jgi:hypothetical protein
VYLLLSPGREKQLLLGSEQLHSETVFEGVDEEKESTSLLAGENDIPQTSLGHWSLMSTFRIAEV